jgi:hypothetical protein
MMAAPTVPRGRILGSMVEGVLLGLLLWLAVSPAVQLAFGGRVSTLRALAVSHWNLGFVFLGLLVVSYPLHLFIHYPSHRQTVRRLLLQLVRGLAVFAAFVFMVEFHSVARFVVPVVSLSYAAYHLRRHGYSLRVSGLVLLAVAFSIVTAWTPIHDARAALCFWVLVPLYWSANLGADGFTVPRLAAWFALYSAIGAGFLAITVYGADGRYVIHGLSAYAFAAAVLGHSWLGAKRLPRPSRVALLVSLVAAFSVALAVDALRFARLWQLESWRDGLAISHTPQQFSKFSALQGYVTPAGADADWFVPPTATCATYDCHTSITAQHNISAHAHSMTSSAFKVELAHFIEERGRLAADHCLGCHAPLGVIAFPASGKVQVDPLTTNEPSFQLGVGCVVCHRARATAPREEVKNASIAIRPLWLEDFWPLFQLETMENFVHSNLELHRQTFRIRDWDPICGSCHVVSLPESLAADRKERATIDQYTSFMSSPYARAQKNCSSCHQERFVNAAGYAVAAHHYLGSGASLPNDDPLPDKQLRDISIGFLSGLGNIEMDIRPGGLPPCLDDLKDADADPSQGRPPLYNEHGVDMNRFAQIEREAGNPFRGTNGGLARRDLLTVKAALLSVDGDRARLRINTTNFCIGHSFPSGEGIKGYLEVFAYDASGRKVGHYGGLGEDGLALPLPTTLGVNAIDANGNVIKDRRYWNAVDVVYRRVLNPGEPSEDTIDVPIEAGTQPTKFEVRWNYLRPEYVRSRERGLKMDLPPIVVGSAVIG